MVSIRLKDISHRYTEDVLAVNEVDWKVPDRSLTALLGPSGCGKTTLMKIISGLLKPTEGAVYFDEEDVTSLTPQERNIGMVFQFPVVYSMSVKGNLKFPLRGENYSEDEIEDKVRETAELLGLSNMLDRSAKELGPALRQTVSIGRAIIRDGTNAILLDEPLSDVEPESKGEIKKALKQVQKRIEETIIYVTHDQSEAMTFANKIAVMREGEIVQYDSEKNLFDEPKDEFVGNFIGSPGMNFMEFSMKNGNMDFGSFSLKVPDGLKSKVEGEDIGLKMGIRPEHIRVKKSEEEGGIPFECSLITDEGYRKILTLEKGNLEMKAVVEDLTISEGGEVYCSLPANKMQVFDSKGNRVSV